MTGLHQSWLVARRELRERSKSTAFRASVVVMILVIVAIIVLPSVISGSTKKNVGVTGSTPSGLAQTLAAQGKALDRTINIHPYADRVAAEDALRAGHVDVLIVDGTRLEWVGKTDDQLKALVTGAITTTAIGQRAAAAGISTDTLRRVLAPVPVENVTLGVTHHASADDQTAAFVMTVVLFIAISTYGSMVLTGVVEEKASRVVEVLLARMSARTLLAGKVIGIGLLGLAQIVITAVAALIASVSVSSVNVPAVRGPVLAWVILWFLLGYALYASVYGAVGSLASRAEDAQSVAGPVTIVLVLAYFLSFAAVGNPTTVWARLVSLFPLSAPLAMPNRIAVGAASWWEPIVAVALTAGTIVLLVRVAGRLYSGAILHSGKPLGLRGAIRMLRATKV